MMNLIKDNIIIKKLDDIKIKINNIINENNNNTKLIKDEISKLNEQINKKFDEMKINNITKTEIKYNIDPKNQINKRVKYIGQVLNGVPEGKGIMYWSDGERYEGEWKNDERNGKGINYWIDGNRYEGDFINNKREGSGIYYWNNGDIYI